MCILFLDICKLFSQNTFPGREKPLFSFSFAIYLNFNVYNYVIALYCWCAFIINNFLTYFRPRRRPLGDIVQVVWNEYFKINFLSHATR